MATAAPSCDDQSTCIIVMGMAGSGKTAFVQALSHYLRVNNQPPYCVNLDPAVHHVPYPTSIDIRDTVKYKEVMKQYGLGPNGGIMTSLNLFSTKFDQVLSLIKNKASQHKYFIFDTPGQIEVFTWSASGMIITEALSSTMRTIVVYVMDTPRSHSPTTFMSNMLYACSILYKTRLPFIVLLNKTDIIDCDFALEWMRDFEAFQEALKSSSEESEDASYMSSLNQSMSLILDEFYTDLMACGVSSLTGDGLSDFMDLLHKAEKEFEEVFKPEQMKLAEKKKKCVENKAKIQSEALSSATQVNEAGEEVNSCVTTDMYISRARCPDDDNIDDSDDESSPMDEDLEEDNETTSFQNFVELHKKGRFVDKIAPQSRDME